MDDFDFDFDFDMPGDFFDISGLENIDLSSALENIDLSGFDLGSVDDIYGGASFDIPGGIFGAEDLIGDISDIFGADEGAGTVVISGTGDDLEGFDFNTSDDVYRGSDLGTGLTYYPGEGYGTGTAGGMEGAEGLIGDTDDIFGMNDGVGTVTITGKKPGDEDDDTRVVPPGPDDKCPPGSEKVYKYRDGSTMTLDCKGNVIGSTPAITDEPPDDPEPCPPGSETTKTYPNGATITFDCKGRVISSTGPTTTNTTTTTTKKIDNTSLLTALLGGLLGLTNKPSGGPAGYKGSIPKYMATRGPSRSPTAGGRRPGGAGIGSLTGGVTYTPVGAAGGGLMGLAEGGQARPARYLRGGTDGMADKIQTDIDGKQPARLSHGEFVIPADVVSHLGNGNSDAGADVLYDMMAKVRKARTGTQKQGKQINPRKYTPA